MHLLQWMHSEVDDVPACMRLGRSGSRSSARAMATNAKPSARAASIVARSVMPPRRMSGVDSARRNWRGEGEEEGLLVGVALEEAVADDAEPEPDGRRQRGAELGQRRVAPEEVHRVGERAAPGELERIERAVRFEEPGDLDALVEPQSPLHAVGHVELGRDGRVRADGVAHGAQHGAGEAGAVLHRAAELVVASVELRAQEGAEEVVVADVHLDGVEARLDGERGGAAVVLGDALDAGDVDRAQARAHGGEAARGRERGARFERALATGPAWPIWAATAAPSAWTASVRRRRPGTVAWSSSRQCRSVRPSGDTAR